MELSILQFQNDGGFHCIAILIDRDLTSHTGKVFGLPNRIPQLRVFRGSGTLDGIGEHFHRIVAERSQGVGQNAIACFVIGDKFLNCGRGIVY